MEKGGAKVNTRPSTGWNYYWKDKDFIICDEDNKEIVCARIMDISDEYVKKFYAWFWTDHFKHRIEIFNSEKQKVHAISVNDAKKFLEGIVLANIPLYARYLTLNNLYLTETV